MIVRMADTVESVMALMQARMPVDSLILLRALYEQVVTYCWIAIEPDSHLELWRSNAEMQMRRLHNDALLFGHTVLSKKELARTAGAKELPPLTQLAGEVDEHWGSRIIGFRPPQRKPNDILNFRGLYVAIYRISSRAAHMEPHSLDPYCEFSVYPRRVRRPEDDESIWWPLAVPLYAQALLVCHEQLNWPKPEHVRAINNAMYSARAKPETSGAPSRQGP